MLMRLDVPDGVQTNSFFRGDGYSGGGSYFFGDQNASRVGLAVIHYDAKYGIRAWQGGGRASARETIGRVAAGAIAKKILREKFGVETLAYVKQVQKISAEINPDTVTLAQVEANIVRCPNPVAAGCGPTEICGNGSDDNQITFAADFVLQF